MLSWPPKKPGGGVADEVDTTISCGAASTSVNKTKQSPIVWNIGRCQILCKWKKARTETITNRLKNEKMTHNGTIKEDLESWHDFMGDGFGLPYKQLCLMTGEELRDIGDRSVLAAYIHQ